MWEGGQNTKQYKHTIVCHWRTDWTVAESSLTPFILKKECDATSYKKVKNELYLSIILVKKKERGLETAGQEQYIYENSMGAKP